MYKQGQIISVDGTLYEYMHFYEGIDNHIVAEIEVDEEGYLTHTHISHAFTTEHLKNDEVHFTKDQWYGIVAHFIREGNFDLNEEEMEDATEDIVLRCFSHGIPKIHELADYIADYMNR